MIAKCNILYVVLQNSKFPYNKILTSLEPTGTLPAHVKNFTGFIHQLPNNVIFNKSSFKLFVSLFLKKRKHP